MVRRELSLLTTAGMCQFPGNRLSRLSIRYSVDYSVSTILLDPELYQFLVVSPLSKVHPV